MSENITASELVELAMQRVADRTSHETFELKTLFSKEEWLDFPSSIRVPAGKLFKKRMEDTQEIECLGPASDNHQEYRKA